MDDRARTSAIYTAGQTLLKIEHLPLFHGDVARTSGPRKIAVFEDFERHPFLDNRDNQWSVEGEQNHAGAVSLDARGGCSVKRSSRRGIWWVRRSARRDWNEQAGVLLISITDLTDLLACRWRSWASSMVKKPQYSGD